MRYGIKEVSELAGVSARTLRYYDEIGLLKPLYVSETGYRYYGEKELALLQQILFYRERGFGLKSIQKVLYQDDFDIMNALQEHLLELEEKRTHMDSLIRTVKQTIRSMKGECRMSDQEKFEAFKEKAIKENEEMYGAEIREKYGESQLDAFNQKMRHMTQEEWETFQSLEREIKSLLRESVTAGSSPEGEEAKRIVVLHRKWLEKMWKEYSPKAHKDIAAMYLCDERFKQYYDKETAGCAEFLKQAVCCWADRLS